LRRIWASKTLEQLKSQFWDSTLESLGKVTFGCSPRGKAQNIQQGWEWCPILKVASRVKLVFKVVLIKSLHHFHLTYTNCPLFLVVQIDFILNFCLWV
jgi:hypothetical protein